MNEGELWLKGLDLASIATSLMIISVAVLIMLSRSSKSQHQGKK